MRPWWTRPYRRALRVAIRGLLKETEANEAAAEEAAPEWAEWWARHGRRELRCILMTAWDPIGVSDAPEAWDEYDGYAAGVATRLREHDDPEEAAAAVDAYLAHVERDFIGIARSDRDRDTVARALVAWHAFSFVHGSRPPD